MGELVVHVWETKAGYHLVGDYYPDTKHLHSVFINAVNDEYEFMVYATMVRSDQVVGSGICKDEAELQEKLKPYFVQFAKVTLERFVLIRNGQLFRDEIVLGNGTRPAVPMTCGHVNQGWTDNGEPICILCNNYQRAKGDLL